METSRADIARILSPLLLFVTHVVYLAAWSTDTFFNKWVDGSFSFFVALVLCNVIRARIVASAREEREEAEPGGEGDARERRGEDGAGPA